MKENLDRFDVSSQADIKPTDVVLAKDGESLGYNSSYICY